MFSRGALTLNAPRSLEQVNCNCSSVILAVSTFPLKITAQSAAVGLATVVLTLRMTTATASQSTSASICAHSPVTLLAPITTLSLLNFVEPRATWRFIGQNAYVAALPCVPAGSGDWVGVKKFNPPASVVRRRVAVLPNGVLIA